MCSVAQNLLSIGEAKGEAIGEAKGEARGIALATYKYVSMGLIAPSEAAKELKISLRKLKIEMLKAGFFIPRNTIIEVKIKKLIKILISQPTYLHSGTTLNKVVFLCHKFSINHVFLFIVSFTLL